MGSTQDHKQVSAHAGCSYELFHPEHCPTGKQQARETDPTPPCTHGSLYEAMPHSTFSLHHCWDLFVTGTLEGISSSTPADALSCQLHSLWPSRDQRGTFCPV